MILSTYATGFALSLGGLLLWFLFQKNNRISSLMSVTFLIGMAIYIYSLFKGDATMDVKMFAMGRDFMVLSFVAAGMSLIAKKTKLFAIGLGIVALLFNFFYVDVMNQTFVNPTPIENINVTTEPVQNKDALNSNSELLVEVYNKEDAVKLKSLFSKWNVLAVRAAFKVEDESASQLDEYIILDMEFPTEENIKGLTEALMETGLVSWVEYNDLVQLSPIEAVPNKKSKRTYGINDPGIEQLWGFDKMEMDQLYDAIKKTKIKPQQKALIAILDTGVDAKHEDIADNYKSIQSKYDNDPNKHGTHCAGIAAAVSNNSKGVASFSVSNDFVEVASVRVLQGFGGGTQQGIIKGMIEAADAGADVISMSLGGRSNASRQKAYEEAVKYCNKKGAIVVVAAGNSNADAKFYCPANTPGVITVSAVDENLDRAKFSNYVNAMKMGIAAPGVNIYSTIPGNQYASFNGTSMATPYVAGLLGLMKSIRPDLDTKEAYKILKKCGKATNQPKETGPFIQPAEAFKMIID